MRVCVQNSNFYEFTFDSTDYQMPAGSDDDRLAFDEVLVRCLVVLSHRQSLMQPAA